MRLRDREYLSVHAHPVEKREAFLDALALPRHAERSADK